MAALEVLSGGFQTTLQDLGRDAYGAIGVPRGGAMDRFALRAANLCAGNAPGGTALEVLVGGFSLRFLRACTVSITGGALDARADGDPVELWATTELRSGSVLTFEGRQNGARAYLAIGGGLAVPPVLGSRSTYLPGGWGGYQGRALRPGDILDVLPHNGKQLRCGAWLPPEARPAYSALPTLRCVLGPHLEFFSDATIAAFLHNDFVVSSASDRMGYRLDGPALPPSRSAQLPSLGVLPGIVQAPPDGRPILLMADAQTTGGYPVIATVIGADLPLAAQLLPGDRLRFRAVSPMVAIAAARAQHDALLSLGIDDDVRGVPV